MSLNASSTGGFREFKHFNFHAITEGKLYMIDGEVGRVIRKIGHESHQFSVHVRFEDNWIRAFTGEFHRFIELPELFQIVYGE